MKKMLIMIAVLLCLISSVTAAECESVTTISIGSNRDDIHTALGNPDSLSFNGSKEIYNLPNGKIAILRFRDNILENGYILF